MHLVFRCQLPYRLFFSEHLLDDFRLKVCCILLPFLFLHAPFYTLQANLFLSDFLGALYTSSWRRTRDPWVASRIKKYQEGNAMELALLRTQLVHRNITCYRDMINWL